MYQAHVANFILALSNVGLNAIPGHCSAPLCICRSSETWMHAFLSILTQINLWLVSYRKHFICRPYRPEFFAIQGYIP